MSQIEEAERAIIDGIGRLALFDRSGGQGFGRDRLAAARSFCVYVVAAPALALLIAVDAVSSTAGTPAMVAITDVLGEIVLAAGFPLLLLPVLRAYRRADRWAWFVTGYNWLKAARVLFLLGVVGLCVGPLRGLGAWPLLAFMGYGWVIEAFMAEAILDVGAVRAGGIVLLDGLFTFGVYAIVNWVATGAFF